MDLENKKNKQGQSSRAPSCGCGCEQESTEASTSAACCAPLPTSKIVSIIKKTVFYLVIIAAIAVVANSISRKNSIKKTSPEVSISTDSLDSCGVRLESINLLNKVAKDKDFIFMVLPDESGKVSGHVSETIKNTLDIISNKGVRAEIFTLDPGSPDYPKLINNYKISEFPAIFALGKGCSMNIVTGKITKEKLLRSYLAASKPISSGISSCCPK